MYPYPVRIPAILSEPVPAGHSHSPSSRLPAQHTWPPQDAPISPAPAPEIPHNAARPNATRPSPSAPSIPRTPRDWTQYWLDRAGREMAVQDHAPSQRAKNTSALRDFLVHHPASPSTLGPDAIGSYLVHCKEQRGLDATTVDQILAALVFFYQHVIKAPRCLAGIPIIQADSQRPSVQSASRIKSILEGMANEKHRLMLSLAYGCGFRASELANLRLNAVDIDSATIRVRGGKTRKARVVKLPTSLLPEIEAYRKRFLPVTYLFESYQAGMPLSKRTFQAVFEKTCAQAGIAQKAEIHSARRMQKTALPIPGTDLRFTQALLGHSNVKESGGAATCRGIPEPHHRRIRACAVQDTSVSSGFATPSPHRPGITVRSE